MRESELLRRVMLAFSNAGSRVFRNQVGVAYQGDATRFAVPTSVTVYPGDVLVRASRTITCGLCVGSSDAIGWTPVVIDGRTVAVFTAVETKSQHGRLTDQQARFLEAVKSAGGIAIEARDVEQAVAELQAGLKLKKT